MMTTSTTILDISHTEIQAGNAVWDQVWKHEPSIEKDDFLLAREQRCPRWKIIIERLQSTFGSIKGLTTIELGSGRGDLSALLAQRGADVTLLDANEHAHEQAKKRFDRLGIHASYVVADMTSSLDAYQKKFDVALSSGVIEHFQDYDRTRVIRSHYDVLRSGGLSIISVPHAWCVSYRLWKWYLHQRGCWPYGMELPYSKREIISRSKQAGLEQIQTHCLGFWQSVGDHWGKNVFKQNVDWIERTSLLDPIMGFVLLSLGVRP